MLKGSEGTSANDLDAAIGLGLEFLRRNQLPSGEFEVYVSPDLNLQYDCVFDSSRFLAALIAYWLGFDDKANMASSHSESRSLVKRR